ncbi:methyltransferase [Fuerstiella marisgermanici]|uniref:Demethylspheroidene O-methyltransferase n=1 Tax=Fuerstiella marisgermanici TaxID=1891926 RepID=A0A1P8WC55_9PLAN|nr:methyltransferase [Fuerstiella marisgermanici]APZ91648.1 Demethylspheroidene O-methyltransferase [Fuerstiella marisgermanici]
MSTDYLIIEQFLADSLQARALQAAFDLSIIDALAAEDCVVIDDLLRGRDCDVRGGHFLLQMLIRSNVITKKAERVGFTDVFRTALKFRDLLTTKLTFSTLVAPDYFNSLPNLLRSEGDFMASSKLFELFDYSRCQDVTTANCMQASRWMQLTTMLTRYEAPVCHSHYDFGQHQRMLDVGGNSGEFVLQICRRESQLQAVVVDLPVVCQVGQRHIQTQPERDRIQFCPADMQQEAFPTECDLITWKSVLHDWPDDRVPGLLQKSYNALPPGGTILIFERQRWDFSVEETPYGLLPVMLFFRSYREPDSYQTWLQQIGFTDVNVQTIPLEVPFLLITAKKS